MGQSPSDPFTRSSNRKAKDYAKFAAQHPAAGRVFNVSDGQYHTMTEIISAMCEALGRTPPQISLPVAPVRLVAGILEDAGRMIGYQSPVGRATINKYTEDIAVDGSLIQKELGFVPQYDLSAGWREVVQEMRRMGEL